ncbi:MAG: DedA family protein [Deltaproteobacteria bacterium]|nr:DedA family protein [Deltaproteobacteria bacterium]
MVEWLDRLVHEAGSTGLVAIALGAFIEYVFPPFPGDTVTVLGGLYAVRGGWPVWLVFASVMAGSLAGAFLDFLFGRWVGRRIDTAPAGAWYLRHLSPAKLREWEARFRTRGSLWLVLNRFLPGLRGPIFVAAGASRIPMAKVLVLGGLSAFLWNGLLFGAGYAVGGQADRLESLVRVYGRVAWAVLACVLFVVLVRWWWRRRRVARDQPRS